MSSIDGLSRRKERTTTTNNIAAKKTPKSSTLNRSVVFNATRSTSDLNQKRIAVKKTSSKSVITTTVRTTKNTSSTHRKNNLVDSVKSTRPEVVPRQQKREDFLDPVRSFDFNLNSDDIDKKELRAAKKNNRAGKPKKKKRTIILSCILGTLAILVTVALVWGNDIIAKITGGKSGIWDVAGLISEEYVDLKTDSKGRTNILVFGTSGYDMNGHVGDVVHDGSQLTDSIMLVSLDQTTGDVAMVSLPRDLKVGKTCTATGKVNEVYWCAGQNGLDEDASARALMDEVTEIFGVDFQYYVHINWGALVTIVDAIGGITVTLDEDINDAIWTHTVIPAGVPTTLNGEQALGLARARHGTAQGDFTRGNSQQKILIAIKDKLLSEGVDLTRAMDLVNAVGDNVRMNFNLDEIKSGAHLLSTIDLSAMRQVPVADWKQGVSIMTTANIGGISYVVPSAGVGNYTEIQSYIAKMFDSDPIIREEPTVEVLNGSEEIGAAETEKEKLIEAGFKVMSTDDMPTKDFSGIDIYILNETKIASKKNLEEKYGVSVKSASELPSIVKSNCDFVVIVGNRTSEE